MVRSAYQHIRGASQLGSFSNGTERLRLFRSDSDWSRRDNLEAAVHYFRSASLRGFRSVVAEQGGNADGLVSSVGLSPEVLDNDDLLVDGVRSAVLLEVAAERLECPDLGLRMAGRAVPVGARGTVDRARQFAHPRRHPPGGQPLPLCAQHLRLLRARPGSRWGSWHLSPVLSARTCGWPHPACRPLARVHPPWHHLSQRGCLRIA